jgi:hypothetical protein
MIDGTLEQVGIGGIFAVLLIREVLHFLKSREQRNEAALDERAIAKIHNTHEILSMKDEDGAPLVFTPRSMSRTISMIAETQRQQADILARLADGIDEIRRR